MRAVSLLVVVVGCGAPAPVRVEPIARPVAPADAAVATPTAPPVTPVDPDAPPAPPPIPAGEDLIAKLPKQDFAPAYRATEDATATKQAAALNAAGVGLHTKKDYAAAEAKYRAALDADPGHVLARYNLACVLNLAGKSDRALALLAELARAKDCEACADSIGRARFDDDWRSQWDREVFWQLALNAQTIIPESCPAGARPRMKGKPEDDHERWCEKNGVKHGPYREAAFMVHCAMACEGSRRIEGVYQNGDRVGIWSHSESYGPEWNGAFDADDRKHGLWLDGDHKAHNVVVYVHGVPEGRMRNDYEGRIQLESAYRGGKLHGMTTEYEGYNPTYVSARGEYVEGKRQGRWTTWNEQGQPVTDGSYDHDKQVGRWRTYTAGVLSLVEHYAAGKLHGERVVWSGATQIAVGHYDQGQRHGEFWYEVGGKRVTTTMDHDSGDWIEYAGGELVAKGKLVKGVREGAWTYSDDDRYWAEGTFAAGKRTGAWTLSQAGKKVFAGTYTDGKRSGEWTKWHDSGKESWRGRFVADQRAGSWTYWNDEGRLIAKGAYTAGKRNGTWELFDPEGEVVQTLVFKADKLVTVDGKRANKKWEWGVTMVDWDSTPAVIEEQDPPLMP